MKRRSFLQSIATGAFAFLGVKQAEAGKQEPLKNFGFEWRSTGCEMGVLVTRKNGITLKGEDISFSLSQPVRRLKDFDGTELYETGRSQSTLAFKGAVYLKPEDFYSLLDVTKSKDHLISIRFASEMLPEGVHGSPGFRMNNVVLAGYSKVVKDNDFMRIVIDPVFMGSGHHEYGRAYWLNPSNKSA